MRTSLSNIVLYVIALITISCNYDHYQEDIDLAFEKCDSAPDSALAILNAIHKEDLSGKILPAYCLAYTMAQDKSGMDVDNDSLIRIAYLAYAEVPQSQYYSRSQYYMGKYYALNDSIEKALSCFSNAKENACTLQDTAYQCLSMLYLSNICISFDQERALKDAQEADMLYSAYSKRQIRNQVLYKVQVSYCFSLANSQKKALEQCKEALKLAQEVGDSISIASTYYSLSSLFGEIGLNDSALFYAKKMIRYWDAPGVKSKMMLANSYLHSDSLEQAAKMYSSTLSEATPVQKYTAFTKLHEIAIQTNDRPLALAYADSAYRNLGEMYSQSLEQRSLQYEKLIAQEKEKTAAEHATYRARWVSCIILLLLCFTVYMYIMYRKRVAEKLREEKERSEIRQKFERDLFERELSMKEEQHKKDLKFRDLRIDIMQKYLMEKMKITQKIKSVKDGKKKAIFTDDDWKEIEIFLENSECGFVSRLRIEFPGLREKDVQLMMLLRVKMPQKCIAEYYGIGEKAIKQKLFLYKEKVGIKDENISLREFIEAY